MSSWVKTKDTLPSDGKQVLCLRLVEQPEYAICCFHDDSWLWLKKLPKDYFQYWRELQTLENSTEWIRMADRLPNFLTKVLVLRHDQQDDYKIADWFWGDNGVDWLSDVGTHPFEYFQYWMKLPDCPEEQ